MKRGRGRPPGTRNKATLMAQAKLVAQQEAKAKAAASAQQQIPVITAIGGGGPATSSTHRGVRLLCTIFRITFTVKLSQHLQA